MPTRLLPNNPSLGHLRKQAKRLRDAVRTGDTEALAQAKAFHPQASRTIDRNPPPLPDPESRADVFVRLACLSDALRRENGRGIDGRICQPRLNLYIHARF